MRNSSAGSGAATTLLAMAAATLLGGCGLGQPPAVRVLDASLGDVTDEAMALRIDVELHNPNPEPRKLQEFEYRVAIDGKPAFTGRRAAETTLAAGEVRRVQLPVVVRFDDAAWDRRTVPPEMSFAVDGRVSYITTSGPFASIRTDLGLGLPKSSFSGAGMLAADVDAGEGSS